MEKRENRQDGPVKGFDELYFEICSQLGKDEEEKKKKNEIDLSKKTQETNTSFSLPPTTWASPDLSRVYDTLQKCPFLIPKFWSGIQEHYDCKNKLKAQELYQTYTNDKEKFSKSKEGLKLLNHALTLAPTTSTLHQNKSNPSEPSPLADPETESQNKEKAEVNADDECSSFLVGQIYGARAEWFYENSEHESCILDTYRSIRFRQTLPSFSTLFTLATSYKELGHYSRALDLFQQALSFLQQSSFDNLTKSTQTLRIVRELKEIKSKTNLVPSKELFGKWDFGPSNFHISPHDEPLKKGQGQLPKVQLYEKSNPVLLTASDALELSYSKEMGRQLIAKRTISPGTVLIVDPAYAWSLYPNSYGTHCQNCCRLLSLSPVPCDQCSGVLYCDEECKSKFDPTHRFECKILKLLDSSECLGEMGVLVYRTISGTNKIDVLSEMERTTGAFAGSGEGEESSFTKNQFQLILGLDSEGQLNPLKFSSVSAQISNSTSRPHSDLFKRTLIAIYFTLCLKFMKYFSSAPGEEEEKDDGGCSFSPECIQTASVLLRILQSVSCNAYSISHVQGERAKNLEIREIGGCTFPTVSCTNHSCAPNIYRYNDGNTCIIRAIGTIEKHEPILDSYGPVYTTQGREERLKTLEKQYFFTCNCRACRENWPIYSKLISIEHQEQFTTTKNKNKNTLSNSVGKSNREKRKETRCQNSKSSKGIKVFSPDQPFENSVKKYLSCKDSLISGKIITEEQESVFCHHLSLLEKLYSPPPHKLIVECQETLKLLWNLSLSMEKDKGNRIDLN